MDCSDLLKLGCDEFTTIEGEEMGGGKKVAHTGETDFAVVYMHMPHSTQRPQDICQAEPEGGSRGLIYIEIGTEIIEGLRG